MVNCAYRHDCSDADTDKCNTCAENKENKKSFYRPTKNLLPPYSPPPKHPLYIEMNEPLGAPCDIKSPRNEWYKDTPDDSKRCFR